MTQVREGKVQVSWWRTRWDSVLMLIGVGLVLWGIFEPVSGERLWYWLDFRLWAWWIFAGGVVAVFLFARRMGGKIEIIGILVCVVVLFARIGFDVCTYVEGKVVAMRTGRLDAYDYQLYLPQGFHDLGAKRPLIVFLHGAGTTDIDALHGWNLASFMKGDFPFIVVAPVTPTHGWEPDRVVGFIDELVGQVSGRLNIDPDRVYLTGFSMGGVERFGRLVNIRGGLRRSCRLLVMVIWRRRLLSKEYRRGRFMGMRIRVWIIVVRQG